METHSFSGAQIRAIARFSRWLQEVSSPNWCTKLHVEPIALGALKHIASYETSAYEDARSFSITLSNAQCMRLADLLRTIEFNFSIPMAIFAPELRQPFIDAFNAIDGGVRTL